MSNVEKLANELVAATARPGFGEWGSLLGLAGDLAEELQQAGVDAAQYGPLPEEMNVVVPYAGGQWLPTVMAVMDAEGLSPKYIHVGGDSTAYWSALLALWRVGETFILVEHDVLPWPGALGQMWRCPEPWCGMPYRLNGTMKVGNGCTKYGAAMMAELPDIWTELTSRTWVTLDTVFADAARRHGHEPHRHEPAVVHLNPAHAADPAKNWVVALLSEAVAFGEREGEG